MAFGATAVDVLSLLTRQGMLPVLAGSGLGLGMALAATRLLSGLLFGVAAADPLTYAAVAVVFVSVAALPIPSTGAAGRADRSNAGAGGALAATARKNETKPQARENRSGLL